MTAAASNVRSQAWLRFRPEYAGIRRIARSTFQMLLCLTLLSLGLIGFVDLQITRHGFTPSLQSATSAVSLLLFGLALAAYLFRWMRLFTALSLGLLLANLIVLLGSGWLIPGPASSSLLVTQTSVALLAVSLLLRTGDAESNHRAGAWTAAAVAVLGGYLTALGLTSWTPPWTAGAPYYWLPVAGLVLMASALSAILMRPPRRERVLIRPVFLIVGLLGVATTCVIWHLNALHQVNLTLALQQLWLPGMPLTRPPLQPPPTLFGPPGTDMSPPVVDWLAAQPVWHSWVTNPATVLVAGSTLTWLVLLALGQLQLTGLRHAHLRQQRQYLARAQRENRQLATRLQRTLESITDALFTLDRDWRLTYINPAAEQALHASSEGLLGRTLWSAYPEILGTEYEAQYRLAMESDQPTSFEAYFAPLDLWTEVNAYPSEEGLAVYFRRINERKQAEQQLRLLERSLESSVNGVLIADARAEDMPIVYSNPAFERITGYTHAEVLGRNCRFLQGADTDPEARTLVHEALEQGTDVHVTLRNYRKDGTPFWNDLYISPVRDDAGTLTHFIGIQHDISAQEDYASQLAFNASHDALTGLPNRALLEDRLQQSCQLTAHQDRQLALIQVDLDGFRLVNESFNHETGDGVLREAATRLEALLRPGDTLARFAGDEFVLLLPSLPEDSEGEVRQLAERAITRLALPYQLDGQEVRLTASAGIAMQDGVAAHPTDLLRQADMAKTRAKQLGRNTYCWFTEDMNRAVQERMAMRSALQRAIDDEALTLHYQPQVEGDGSRLLGIEALIRWQHPELGALSPADFVPLAEDTGLMLPMSRWILRQACDDALALNQADPARPLFVSVNLSPTWFEHEHFLDEILQIVDASGLPRHQLELELTENILAGQSDEAIARLAALRRHGIRVAIDDFGTGFSSLSYLKYLDADKLKIDRAFIQDLTTDPRDAAIVQGMLSMAGALEISVVAEGVETQAQHHRLREMGCEHFQGFLFARPMPLKALTAFLAERQPGNR